MISNETQISESEYTKIEIKPVVVKGNCDLPKESCDDCYADRYCERRKRL